MDIRQLFFSHVAQTSPAPMGLEPQKAEGIYICDAEGRRYIDAISGFSVMNLGHGLREVKDAIHAQVEEYMHVMVYGEMIEKPQVAYARQLVQSLPDTLDCVYFTNSGAEAVEGAMKLAKRATGRARILAFNNAYHGSTQGALSLIGAEYWRQAYRPLLPMVEHLAFNDEAALAAVDETVAAVVVEMIQAEAGALPTALDWMQKLEAKCRETGALLVVDEIQTGFGRSGTLWAFEQYGIVPDILMLGKALGGGLPLGAFIAARERMHLFTENPVLGHISTFAGHPVCCAAGLASFMALREKMPELRVAEKEKSFREKLAHPAIKSITGIGLLLGVQFEYPELCIEICHRARAFGVITDWFLFAADKLRLAPPLIINEEEIGALCSALLATIDAVLAERA